MKADFIKEGKIYSDNGYGTTHIFEIVESVPACYSVWNIPEICGGEYIPFCMTVRPGDKECFDVNINTLKAVKMSKEEVKILQDAAHAGAGSVKKANSVLKRTAKTAYMRQRQERAKKALPILERITN